MGKNTKDMDRRKFMKTVGLGGASSIAALSSGLTGQISAGENKKKKSSREISVPTRILGKTKTPVSILALGGMVDLEVNQILLKMAIKFGVTYWDTAHMYQNGKSEIGIGKYFKKFPENRKKVFLCTKASGKTDPEGMTQRLHLSLERMKTDYIDLYLMHNPKKPDLLTPEVKAWAEKAKREGKIKFFGFSTHSNMAQMLLHASKLGWIDAILTSYNYHLMLEDAMKAGIEACHKAGIGLTAMKSQGEVFKFFNSSKELSITEKFINKGYTLQQAKLKAVWGNEMIASCCSLMKNMTTMSANVAAAVDKTELAYSDVQELKMFARRTCDSYCLGCSQICDSGMGAESKIADILRYMMYYNSYGENDEARSLFFQLPEHIRKNIKSTDFSAAELVCPQKIEIGKMMKKASEMLG